MRVLIIGNSGSGKTTLARKLATAHDLVCRSMDQIAWNPGPERKSVEDSIAELDGFLGNRRHWVIEGCYADLTLALLLHCTELRFLNPGLDVCLRHLYQRPFEPDKFQSKEEQDRILEELLVPFVKTYPTRLDEFGLAAHRRVYNTFVGAKREYLRLADYGLSP